MKEFTTKEVFILVLVIVIGIAFIESGHSWRGFFLNIMMYGLIVEFLVILLSVLFDKK